MPKKNLIIADKTGDKQTQKSKFSIFLKKLSKIKIAGLLTTFVLAALVAGQLINILKDFIPTTPSLANNCPSGYTWNGTQCEQRTVKIDGTGCPPGYTDVGGSPPCVKYTAVNPPCTSPAYLNTSTNLCQTDGLPTVNLCFSGDYPNGANNCSYQQMPLFDCATNAPGQVQVFDSTSGYNNPGLKLCTKTPQYFATGSCAGTFDAANANTYTNIAWLGSWDGYGGNVYDNGDRLDAIMNYQNRVPAGSSQTGQFMSDNFCAVADGVTGGPVTYNGNGCPANFRPLLDKGSRTHALTFPSNDLYNYSPNPLTYLCISKSFATGAATYSSAPNITVVHGGVGDSVVNDRFCGPNEIGQTWDGFGKTAPYYPAGAGHNDRTRICSAFNYQAPVPGCPVGQTYWQAGNFCYTTTAPAFNTCPSGYTFNGTQCEERVAKITGSACPTGYTDEGGSPPCAKYTAATFTSCPSGYTFNGTQCEERVAKIVTGTGYSCPNGGTVSGSTCIIDMSGFYTSTGNLLGQNSCNTSTHYGLIGGVETDRTAANNSAVVYYYICIPNTFPGFTSDNGLGNTQSCSGSQYQIYSGDLATLGPGYLCVPNFYQGFSSSNTSCGGNQYALQVQNQLLFGYSGSFDPLFLCVPNSVSYAGTPFSTYGCPAGYTDIGGTLPCIKYDAALFNTCPSGYTFNGTQCEDKVAKISVTSICPSGFTDLGGSPPCVKYAAEIVCNSNQYFNTTTFSCININILNSSQINPILFNCPSGVGNSVVTCTFPLPTETALPAIFKIGIGDSVLGGTCTQSGTDYNLPITVTCINVPTGSNPGIQPINAKIGTDAAVNTGETTTVTSRPFDPLLDIPTFASVTNMQCSPEPTIFNSTYLSCNGVLPQVITPPVGTLYISLSNGTPSTCIFTGQNYNCTSIASGSVAGTFAYKLAINSDTPANTDKNNTVNGVNDDTDGDGMPDGWEVANTLNPLVNDASADPDFDGLTNLQEFQNGTNPNNPDTDGDGMPDGWEVANTLNPLVNDASADPDNDNLTNLKEYQNGTNPKVADTDGDGMPDGWEVTYGLNPLVNDASADPDNDSLTNLQEFQNGTNPNVADTDGDGMPDGWEVTNGTNPKVADAGADPDNDGLTNAQELQLGFNPNNSNSDSSLTPTVNESTNSVNDGNEDLDGDGLSNKNEFTAGTNPNVADTDGDGMPDGWEVTNGTNPKVADAGADPDNDGLTNLQEFQNGTNPNVADTDGDGMPDGWEVTNGTNPKVADAGADPDNDGLTNAQELQLGFNPNNSNSDSSLTPTVNESTNSVNDGNEDLDGDGLSNKNEFTAGTNPNVADTDGDGMPDGWEVSNGLNPKVNDAGGDPDNDGLTNLQEFQNGTNPNVADTDGDGVNDGDEIKVGTDPKSNTSTPPKVNDVDGDGVTNTDEKGNSNSGDANGDGTPDYIQKNVAGVKDPTSTKYVVVESSSSCPISNTSYAKEAALGEDKDYDYLNGLLGFTLTCNNSTVKLFWYNIDNSKTYTLRKFGPETPGGNTNTFYPYSGNISTQTVGGNNVLQTTYTLTDGQKGDATGVDGKIVDPVGLATAAAAVPSAPTTPTTTTTQLPRTGGLSILGILAAVLISGVIYIASIKKEKRNKN